MRISYIYFVRLSYQSFYKRQMCIIFKNKAFMILFNLFLLKFINVNTCPLCLQTTFPLSSLFSHFCPLKMIETICLSQIWFDKRLDAAIKKVEEEEADEESKKVELSVSCF